MKLQKLVYFIHEIKTNIILEDNIEPLDVQAALDRAVMAQKYAGLYRDKPTFMLSSRMITTADGNTNEN
jgi:hypothetical protein